MTDNGRALSLLREFNEYFPYTQFFQERTRQAGVCKLYVMTPEREQALLELDEWCRERGFDTRFWIYSRFRITNWRFPPKFSALIPSKRNQKKAIAYYQKIQAETSPLFSQVTHQRIEQQASYDGRLWQPLVALNRTVELRKARYLRLGQAHVCLSNVQSETYGYHPGSQACLACPRAWDCAMELKRLYPTFDLVAERHKAVVSGSVPGVG